MPIFYDLRGGGIETGFKQDQQGLGRRNKKCFAAQAMLLWLEALAHNVLIWVRGWLAPMSKRVSGYGLVRLIRDVLSIPGRITLDAEGRIRTLMLSQAHPLAGKVPNALQSLLARQNACVCLGEIQATLLSWGTGKNSQGNFVHYFLVVEAETEQTIVGLLFAKTVAVPFQELVRAATNQLTDDPLKRPPANNLLLPNLSIRNLDIDTGGPSDS